METASLHLAHRWSLGYALDEPLPDHSTLSKVRQRLGAGVFRRFFEHVVERCRDAGLVWGQELFFDATRVRANAAVDSVVPRLGRVVGDHLEALFPEGGDAGAGAPGVAAGEATPLPVTVVPLPPRPLPVAPPAPRRAGPERVACARALGYGQLMACAIGTPGEQRTHVFTGKKGEMVRVTVAGEPRRQTTLVQVVRPDGDVLCGSSIWNKGRAYRGDCRLDVDGPHTVLVVAADRIQVGGYTVRLQRLSDPEN